MSERMFDKDELQALGQRTLDRLTDAIDDGDQEVARDIAQKMYNEFLGMHDLYRNWITAVSQLPSRLTSAWNGYALPICLPVT